MVGTRINIWRVKNVVSFQITEIGEEFEKYRRKGLLFKSSDGFEIRSDYFDPGLTENKIVLAGDNKYSDHNVAFVLTSGEEKASELVDKINRALFEWKNEKFEIEEYKYEKLFNDLISSDQRIRRGGMGMSHIRDRFKEHMEAEEIRYNQNYVDESEEHFTNFMILSASEFQGKIVRSSSMMYDNYRYENNGFQRYNYQ